MLPECRMAAGGTRQQAVPDKTKHAPTTPAGRHLHSCPPELVYSGRWINTLCQPPPLTLTTEYSSAFQPWKHVG